MFLLYEKSWKSKLDKLFDAQRLILLLLSLLTENLLISSISKIEFSLPESFPPKVKFLFTLFLPSFWLISVFISNLSSIFFVSFDVIGSILIFFCDSFSVVAVWIGSVWGKWVSSLFL